LLWWYEEFTPGEPKLPELPYVAAIDDDGRFTIMLWERVPYIPDVSLMLADVLLILGAADLPIPATALS
jgi:hypothetical protein